MEAVRDFIFLGSTVTAHSDCSHEIKRLLLLGRKAMTNLDSILKSKYITLLTKVHIVKAMLSPAVIYTCKNWTINKVEHPRIDVFELCWGRLLRVPWTTRRSNQSILNEISPEYKLEGLMLKLKLQYFWPPDGKSWLIWKNLDSGKYWGQEKRGQQRIRWLDDITYSWTWGDEIGGGQRILACCSPWGCKQLDMTWQLSNSWIKTYVFLLMDFFLDILMDTFGSSPNIFYPSVLLVRMYNRDCFPTHSPD